jgi:EmrB/QacA subfamily drug resistance transporter
VAINKPLIILALILATALSALDGTVVTTALPTIVGILGGLPLYSLVVAAYLLTATTTVPIYGKLSDMYGRKPVFMAGSGLFILGSALCGLAWDMPSLIAFRALQGVGAGAVLPISLTIIGDLFDIEERARMQGIFGAVWGVSSVIGPVIGGAIVQFFSWRWVFFINVPVGIFSSLLFFLYLREPRIHNRQRVDIAGAITLTFGVGLVLVALQTGGQTGWLSPTSPALWGGAIIFLALFVLFERRAAAPILSFELISRPVIYVACIVGMLGGGVLIGFSAYVPLIVQGAWGGTPIEAGLIVAPLSISWPVFSTLSGRLVKRYSFRAIARAGMAILLAGCALMLLVGVPFIAENPALRVIVVAGASFVSGAGFGLNTTSMLIAVQSSVPWSERGISTASVQFFRNMGNSMAAAVLGAVLTLALTPALANAAVQALVHAMPAAAQKATSDPTLGPVNALFDLTIRDTIAHQTRSVLASALENSLWWVFFAMALMALAGAIFVTRFPRVVQRVDDVSS